jgi:hypothetical protein
MKATGAEIWNFWMNGWPQNWYNDAEIEVESPEGDCLLEMDQEYDLRSFGYICWPGTMGFPRDEAPAHGKDTVPFAKWFSFWKRGRTTVTFAVTMPRKDEAAFREFCLGHGWKVDGGRLS